MPKKGYKQTEEHINKGAKARIGTHRSIETRLKMSKAQLGEKHPMFGKHHSEETKKKMRENHTDISGNKNPMFGKHPSEETRIKLSDSHKGKPSGMLGKHHSEKTKKKMSLMRLGNKNTLGFHPSIETRKKLSDSLKGAKCYNWKGGISPEHKIIRRSFEYRLWRGEVYIRDKFTCQKCLDNRGGNLRPHHIKNFSQYPELRFIVNNGITLCKQCHELFHKIYGKQNNNEEQLNQFLNNENLCLV